MTIEEMASVIADCRFPDYQLIVTRDGRGEIYLQGFYVEADVKTGFLDRQATRRWFLSPAMTKSEIVQTAFKCILTSAEHRVREWFHYDGHAVYGPHFDVDALWELCERGNLDKRA